MNRTVFDVLEEIESTQGSNAKVAVLQRDKDVKHLSTFFRLVEDPTIDFGIKKIPDVDLKFSVWDVTLDRTELFLFCLEKELAPRKLTGNAARSRVLEHLEKMTDVERKWCIRLLLKNLRVGISGKFVKKVWPDLVEVYEVLKATAVPVDKQNNPLKVVYPVYVEPKLDGLRCIAEKKNGVVTLRTRNGNVLETLPQIQEALEKSPRDNFILDGEAMADRIDAESWNDSASVLMSYKNKKDDCDTSLNVFDAMSIEDWSARYCTLKLIDRLNIKETIIASTSSKKIRSVKGKVVNNNQELKDYYDECLELGYEGIMIKDLNGLYEWKRVKTSVMKYKPIETFDGVVTGMYTGTVGTKHEGLFGGFYVVLPNGVVTRVGGGFNDDNREKINADPEDFVGQAIEIEGAKGLAKNGKIRFPRFLRFRSAADVDPVVFSAYEEWLSNILATRNGYSNG